MGRKEARTQNIRCIMNPNADISPAWSLQRPCLPLTLLPLPYPPPLSKPSPPLPPPDHLLAPNPTRHPPNRSNLTVQNTGPVPISYWCSGLGTYPDAADYRVCIQRISPDTQSFAPLHPFNGQPVVATGKGRCLPPPRRFGKSPRRLRHADPRKIPRLRHLRTRRPLRKQSASNHHLARVAIATHRT